VAESVEESIRTHIREKSSASLRKLYESLLAGKLLIRLFSATTTDASGRTDVPVNCIRLPDGAGCLPAFTSLARFLESNEVGTLYTELRGAELFKMVSNMQEIDCIYVNYSEREGTPKGQITRPEFELLAKGIFPEN
jgi:hypothetical protein